MGNLPTGSHAGDTVGLCAGLKSEHEVSLVQFRVPNLAILRSLPRPVVQDRVVEVDAEFRSGYEAIPCEIRLSSQGTNQ